MLDPHLAACDMTTSGLWHRGTIHDAGPWVTLCIFVLRYVMLIVEVGSISIKLSEYRVLCIHAVEQAISVLR